MHTLLLDLVTETLASKIRHVDGSLVGENFGLESGLL
jgi:hypothetical protein